MTMRVPMIMLLLTALAAANPIPFERRQDVAQTNEDGSVVTLCFDSDTELSKVLGYETSCDDNTVGQMCNDTEKGQQITWACPKTCGACNVKEEDEKPEECVNSDSATMFAAMGVRNCCYAMMQGYSCSSAEMKTHCARKCRHCTPTGVTSSSYSHTGSYNSQSKQYSYNQAYKKRGCGSGSGSSKGGKIIGCVVGGLVVLLIAICLCYCCAARQGSRDLPPRGDVVQSTEVHAVTGVPTKDLKGTEIGTQELKSEFGGRQCVSVPFVSSMQMKTTETGTTTPGPAVYHN